MGLAHHCVYLSFHSYIILEIRQYPKVGVAGYFENRSWSRQSTPCLGQSDELDP